MKSHTCFRFVPIRWPWMILNGVIALILRFSPNSIALLTDYVTVVEARLTIAVKYCLWVPVFHFRPKLMYPAARSLCNSWASCQFYVAKTVNTSVFWPPAKWRMVYNFSPVCRSDGNFRRLDVEVHFCTCGNLQGISARSQE